MDAFTAHKYATSWRESLLREIAHILADDNNGIYSLVEACQEVGLNPQSLSQSEIEFVKKLVG